MNPSTHLNSTLSSLFALVGNQPDITTNRALCRITYPAYSTGVIATITGPSLLRTAFFMTKLCLCLWSTDIAVHRKALQQWWRRLVKLIEHIWGGGGRDV